MSSSHTRMLLSDVARDYAASHSPPTSNHETTRLLIAAAFEAGYMEHVRGSRLDLGKRMSNRQTSQHVAPPSIALTMMAWTLACYRYGAPDYPRHGGLPRTRRETKHFNPISVEHYRILDRLRRGAKP